MKIRVVSILLFLMNSPLLAAPVDGGWGIWEAVGRWLNLLILFGVIAYFAKEPIKKFFASRRESIQHEIQEARRLREEAEEKFAALQAKMDQLDQELEEIRRQARHLAELEQQRIHEHAELEANKILSVAQHEIAVLTRAARAELKAYVAQLAIRFAEQQLRERMGPAVQTDLVDRFVIQLGGREGKP